MYKITIKGSPEKTAQLKKIINRMSDDPLRIGHFPKPLIVSTKKSLGVNWACTSETEDFKDSQWLCCTGYGESPEEAYADWLIARQYKVEERDGWYK